ncbi:phosphoglycerate mutase family protein [Antribacter sp. KLBMP9083]|uniref:Phosphoglycerate mutase family protein n=1 Tax=Antribacter soli TaxID=2910976 RepID=A0AA41QE88_9MICO|nr:histidine phosphatase family protein [Antribacter soli]MCF4121849.1 phosphoglycerate mutase family protein [Antribacter soli]
MTLYLVRHGRPLVDRTRSAATWPLDPTHEHEVLALRVRRSLPSSAAWCSSPEPKALETARLLADGHVTVVSDLREQVRGNGGWVDDLPAVMQAAFARPDEPAMPGWESLSATRERVGAAARGILARHLGQDVVLVGHGTAWTLLAAELTGTPPDVGRWARLAMPDVIRVEHPR